MLAETNWKAIQEQKTEVVVLPWGATEAHNYHLPYATDNIQAEAVAAEAARLAWEAGTKVMVLPAIPFGVNTGQADITLDINLNPSTQLSILDNIVAVLNRQGIHKLLVVNGHGGNDFKPMLRELGLRYPDMFLVTCNWFQTADRRQFFERPGDHADEMETSMIQYLRPDLTRPLEEAGDGREYKSKLAAIREGWAWSERLWSQATEDTGVGNPAAATPEKGQAFFEATTRNIAGLLTELATVDPKDRYIR
ncbi:creatininase family protein [Pontibacter sp. HJ8]